MFDAGDHLVLVTLLIDYIATALFRLSLVNSLANSAANVVYLRSHILCLKE